ncbi:MAG: hypothetical protein LBO69_02960 [Ignavibacteria bacterium]|jgi:hypothetical protein|nr:hypothetical protein [Ignavibacteria bacterium]
MIHTINKERIIANEKMMISFFQRLSPALTDEAVKNIWNSRSARYFCFKMETDYVDTSTQTCRIDYFTSISTNKEMILALKQRGFLRKAHKYHY